MGSLAHGRASTTDIESWIKNLSRCPRSIRGRVFTRDAYSFFFLSSCLDMVNLDVVRYSRFQGITLKSLVLLSESGMAPLRMGEIKKRVPEWRKIDREIEFASAVRHEESRIPKEKAGWTRRF